MDNQFEYYAQDNWRIKSNLTITYGFRHSLFRQQTDANGMLGQFVPPFYDPSKAPCVLGNAAGGSAASLDTSLNASAQVVSACNPNFDPLNGYMFPHPPAGGTDTKCKLGDNVGQECQSGVA